MRKLKPLLLLPAICLASCSKQGYTGTYSFQLGKMGSTNIRLALTLTDNPVVNEEKHINAKEFSIEANLPNSTLDDVIASLIDEDSGLSKEEAAEFIADLINKIKQDVTLYYNVGDYDTNYGKQMKLGALINLEEFEIDVPNDLIEHVVCAYINSTTLTLQVPVSKEDLLLQLCWYGLFINLDSPTPENYIVQLDPNLLPGKVGEERYGSHPQITYDENGKIIGSEVYEMNANFAKEFSNTPAYVNKTGTTVAGFMAKDTVEEDMYFFKNTGYEVSGPNIIVGLHTKNDYGVYDDEKEVLLTIDTSKGCDQDYFKVIQIKDVETGNIIQEKEYYREPYVFRDFHDIKVGLVRE